MAQNNLFKGKLTGQVFYLASVTVKLPGYQPETGWRLYPRDPAGYRKHPADWVELNYAGTRREVANALCESLNFERFSE